MKEKGKYRRAKEEDYGLKMEEEDTATSSVRKKKKTVHKSQKNEKAERGKKYIKPKIRK